MSKSHCEVLLGLYHHIWEDVMESRPELRVELQRDLYCLHEFIRNWGLRVFMRDLPAVGKHFDKCLASGQYEHPNLPLTKQKGGSVKCPLFLGVLHLLVFDEFGVLRENCDTEAVIFLRQIYFAAKKTAFDCDQESVDAMALDFLEVDLTLPHPDSFWEGDGAYVEKDMLATYRGFGDSGLLLSRGLLLGFDTEGVQTFLTCLDFVTKHVCSSWDVYFPRQWRHRHGPGAISETTRKVFKYHWTNWSEVLESEFPIADHGFHSYAAWADRFKPIPRGLKPVVYPMPVKAEEPSSRMVAVPKTFKKPRLIAAEPAEHQWCQQNIWHYLRSMTEGSWLNHFVRFDDQSLNRELCRRGSLTGSLVTVDLSAASDRMTCHVVGQMFRFQAELLCALRATRTRTVNVSNCLSAEKRGADLDRYPLRKFSTMGSACTFPVQTLVFLSIALAASLQARSLAPTLGNIQMLRGEVAVFGDDIIVPTEAQEILFKGLELLYFKVNKDKSFVTGRFRESCGLDAFRGVDVTPVYWKGLLDGSPESISSTVAVRNNFYRKFLMNAAKYTETVMPTAIPIAWVPMGSGAFGLTTRVMASDGLARIWTLRRGIISPKRRWNDGLHVWEICTGCLVDSTSRIRVEGNAALLQYFTEEPSPLKKWEAGYDPRPTLRWRRKWVSEQDYTSS